MVANPRQALHELIDQLSDDDLQQLSSSLRLGISRSAKERRPLREEDILLAEPILPEEESADEMIDTIRRWRREGGAPQSA